MIEEWRAFVTANAEWFLLGSFAGLVIGLLVTPILVTRIPPDYFSHRRRHTIEHSFPVLNLLLLATTNVVGATLAIVGLALLFLPGQGLLTLLLGLMIMNYPGKFTLERWLVQRPHVLPALNWLRARRGHPPLESP